MIKSVWDYTNEEIDTMFMGDKLKGGVDGSIPAKILADKFEWLKNTSDREQ